MSDEIYGARASIFIEYDNGIENLAGKLSSCLIIPDFTVDYRESPPYELVGSFELLGFEGLLETSDEIIGYAYRLTMNTEHCLDEEINNKMHDLSLWLARYIFEIGKIQTYVNIDSRQN